MYAASDTLPPIVCKLSPASDTLAPISGKLSLASDTFGHSFQKSIDGLRYFGARGWKTMSSIRLFLIVFRLFFDCFEIVLQSGPENCRRPQILLGAGPQNYPSLQILWGEDREMYLGTKTVSNGFGLFFDCFWIVFRLF